MCGQGQASGEDGHRGVGQPALALRDLWLVRGSLRVRTRVRVRKWPVLEMRRESGLAFSPGIPASGDGEVNTFLQKLLETLEPGFCAARLMSRLRARVELGSGGEGRRALGARSGPERAPPAQPPKPSRRCPRRPPRTTAARSPPR